MHFVVVGLQVGLHGYVLALFSCSKCLLYEIREEENYSGGEKLFCFRLVLARTCALNRLCVCSSRNKGQMDFGTKIHKLVLGP